MSSPPPRRPGTRLRAAGRMRAAILVCGLLLLSFITGALAARSAQRDLPSVRELENYRPPSVSRIFASDGSPVAMLGEEKRIILSWSEIPQDFINAVIATEDQHFYSHFGIDAQGLFRAGLGSLRSGKLGAQGGGSTLTMQLARNLFLDPKEKTLRRKFQEMLLAVEIERAYSKQEILTFYSNQIYMGPRRYGVEAASQYYFGKPAREMTLDESTLLAAIIQNPAAHSPYNHPESAIARRKHVLSRMVEEGMITPDQAAEVGAMPLHLAERSPSDDSRGSYFVEEVRRSLVDRFGEAELYQGGMRVYTTLDQNLQRIATGALRKGLLELQSRRGWRGVFENVGDGKRAPTDYEHPSWGTAPSPGTTTVALVTEVNDAAAVARIGDARIRLDAKDIEWSGSSRPSSVFRPGDLVPVRVDSAAEDGSSLSVTVEPRPEVEGAVVAIEPGTGAIRALVGGYDFARSQFDRAVQARRQPGSAFKTFVIAAALDNGVTASDKVLDEPTVFVSPGAPEPYQPENYYRQYSGLITVRETLEESRNIAAVRLLSRIGPDPVIACARAMGIDSSLQPFPSLALGSFEVTPLELTAAYAVLPNQGVWVEPHMIASVLDSGGRVVEETVPRTRDALSPTTAYLVTNLLRGVVQSGTAQKARALGRDLAGKTGTTNDYTDAWFVGFSPTLTVGVWVGLDRKESLGQGEAGARAALPIWMDIMEAALEGKPNEEFLRPSGVVFVPVDRSTGLRATFASGCDPTNVILEGFTEGEEVIEDCSPAEHYRLTLPYFLQRFPVTPTGDLVPDVPTLAAMIRDEPVSLRLGPDARRLEVYYDGRALSLPLALDALDRQELILRSEEPPEPDPDIGRFYGVDGRPATVLRFPEGR